MNNNEHLIHQGGCFIWILD